MNAHNFVSIFQYLMSNSLNTNVVPIYIYIYIGKKITFYILNFNTIYLRLLFTFIVTKLNAN